MIIPDEKFQRCLNKARELVSKGFAIGDLDEMEVAETLLKLEIEKEEKDLKSDMLLDYNDEIVSIEEEGILETIDISVTGDNLFYCNDILTKNSFGLPATADFMFALISTENLESVGQLMVKQLKNRYNDLTKNKRFLIGVDRSRMKLFDVENPSDNIVNDNPVHNYNHKKDFSKIKA
jgi:hypothetical protein